jgi:hypothetical protein
VDVVKWEPAKQVAGAGSAPRVVMSSGALLHERLGRLAPIAGQKMAAAAAAAASADPDLHPAGGSGSGSEPKLLNDDQMKDFIVNGYLALPVSDMPAGWHEGLWQKCHDWVFEGGAEAQQDSRNVFPEIPELTEVRKTPSWPNFSLS